MNIRLEIRMNHSEAAASVVNNAEIPVIRSAPRRMGRQQQKWWPMSRKQWSKDEAGKGWRRRS
jgi:hypothetical protein